MDLSNSIVFAFVAALLITLAVFISHKMHNDKNKDQGEYLRLFSFSGVILLGLQKLAPGRSKKVEKNGGSNDQIHTGNPSF